MSTPTTTTAVIRTGSCLCGGIKLTIQGEPISTNLCHCTSCQKGSGGIFTTLAVFKTEQVTFTESSPSLISTYADKSPESGDIVYRKFCSRCGSPLSGTKGTKPEFVIIAAGIVDGDKNVFRPRLEFFCRTRVDWIKSVEDASVWDTLPGR
ncbi:glutathione-dependent formaldehyde-activating, GFA [Poronia punctata]|nr:glutathione-dependent formaldehyde-activating, GFA [Poronia punctata]